MVCCKRTKKSKKQYMKSSNFKLSSKKNCATVLKHIDESLSMKVYNGSSARSLSLMRSSTTQTVTNESRLMRLFWHEGKHKICFHYFLLTLINC